MPKPAPLRARTEPVLAVLVCHDGEPWLPTALSALRELTPRPRHVLAVDTGSVDLSAALLADASDVVDGIIAMPRGTGFGDAVRAALDVAVRRWGDPGRWIWLLHDDCAPSPDCLGVLLSSASVSPSAAVLGPLALDWSEPRLVVDAGLSTDASGHRQAQVDTGGKTTEVLAVPSAGALVRRDVWEALGGYDPALPLLRDDLDFGWRVNRSGSLVLSVPAARIRHARAVRERDTSALGAVDVRAADRAFGLRTVLVNRSLLGLPRLVSLCLLRALGFVLVRRLGDAHAELFAVRYLVGGHAGLRAARQARPAGRAVRGLLTSRRTRLLANWVRRRAAADAVLAGSATGGSLPRGALGWLPAETPSGTPESAPRAVGPDALPAGALGRRRAAARRSAGLRRPVAVAVSAAPKPKPYPTPSPMPRDGSGDRKSVV